MAYFFALLVSGFLRPATAKVVLLVIETQHDLISPNLRNYCSIAYMVYMRSCRTIIHSTAEMTNNKEQDSWEYQSFMKSSPVARKGADAE